MLAVFFLKKYHPRLPHYNDVFLRHFPKMVVIMAAQTQDGQNVLILTAAPCTKVFNSFYHSMITSERDLIVWKAS